jgi:hypothetical protein
LQWNTKGSKKSKKDKKGKISGFFALFVFFAFFASTPPFTADRDSEKYVLTSGRLGKLYACFKDFGAKWPVVQPSGRTSFKYLQE